VFEILRRRAGRTVLIVAENPTGPVLDSAFLRQPDIRLLTTYPDAEGLAIARRERPSLIIEDLQAPDHVGLAFCRELREHPATRTIPLILVTSPELRQQARAARADALLDKPVVKREFFNAVQRFVSLPKRRAKRVTINLRFSYVVNGHSGQAFSRDLSVSGAFLKTDRLLPLGTPIQLRFRLPGAWEELECGGVVRSTSRCDTHAGQLSGVGVEFEGLAPADSELLETFVERQLRRPLLLR
jgi:CheY-like chemotaxis protein